MIPMNALYISYFENILNKCLRENNYNQKTYIVFKLVQNQNKKSKQKIRIKLKIKNVNKIIKNKICIDDNRERMKISMSEKKTEYRIDSDNFRDITSVESINLMEEIRDIHNKKKPETTEDYFKIISDKYPLINNNLTCGEYKEFISEMEKQIDKMETGKKKIINMNFDYSALETLRIIDKRTFNHVDVYIYDNYLINKNNKHIGNIKHWIDEDDEIPRRFKTLDNTVLNPKSNLPITELFISESGSMFCNINKGVYREFEYIEDEEIFITTHCILR